MRGYLNKTFNSLNQHDKINLWDFIGKSCHILFFDGRFRVISNSFYAGFWTAFSELLCNILVIYYWNVVHVM